MLIIFVPKESGYILVQSAEILVDGKSIGYLGRLHPSLENALDLGITWVAELDQQAVLQSYVSNFTELSRFPSVRRDIALLISDKIEVRDIQQLIKQTGGEFTRLNLVI